MKNTDDGEKEKEEIKSGGRGLYLNPNDALCSRFPPLGQFGSCFSTCTVKWCCSFHGVNVKTWMGNSRLDKGSYRYVDGRPITKSNLKGY